MTVFFAAFPRRFFIGVLKAVRQRYQQEEACVAVQTCVPLMLGAFPQRRSL